MFLKIGTACVTTVGISFLLIYMFPHHFSLLYSKFTHSSYSRFLIWPYSRIFGVNSQQILDPDSAYRSLHTYFVRKIKPRKIDIDSNIICSPADCQMISYSQLKGPNQKLTVKGKSYSIQRLLNEKYVNMKNNPNNKILHASLYLSPKDYHHFHAPYDIQITNSKPLGGYPEPGISNYSVRPSITKQNPQIYLQNHRQVIQGRTKWGKIYLACVGAYLVNGIHIENAGFYKKGERIGNFQIGSSIIMLIQVPQKYKMKQIGQYKYGQSLIHIQNTQQ